MSLRNTSGIEKIIAMYVKMMPTHQISDAMEDVFDELKTDGVQDIMIIFTDGLSGNKEAFNQ